MIEASSSGERRSAPRAIVVRASIAASRAGTPPAQERELAALAFRGELADARELLDEAIAAAERWRGKTPR